VARKQFDTETHHVVINSSHDEIHRGNAFVIFYDTGSITSSSSKTVLINVGSTGMHIQSTVDATGTFLLDIYEGPTVSANGTAVSVINKNRESARASNATVFHTPTTSADGAHISSSLVPGGVWTGGASGVARDEQFMLNEDTSYLVRCTNIGTGSARGLLRIEWYERHLGV